MDAPTAPGGAASVGPVAFLMAYVVLLFFLPARLVVGFLGGVGQPALLLGAFIALAWAVSKVTGDRNLARDPNPIRWALLAFAGLLAVNYTWLQTRPQTTLESTSSTRQLIIHLVVIGVALACCDSLRTRAAIDRVVRAIVVGAGVCAVVGYVQFFTGIDLPAMLDLPGLDYATPFGGVYDRADLNRPAGTMLHPIEFGVVMGACLPLAIHVARHSRAASSWYWWTVTGLVAGAALLSVSRSGVLAAIAGVAVLAIDWDWRRRLNGAILGSGLVVVAWLTVPGLIGTFRYLFRALETDPSARARVERFPIAYEATMEAPVLGRGLGTYTVEEGTLLDQQLYQSAIELGLLGLAITVLIMGVGIGVGISSYLHPAGSAQDRHLVAALVGMIMALAVTTATYTAFWYRVHLSLLLLALGLLGASWALRTGASPGMSESTAPA